METERYVYLFSIDENSCNIRTDTVHQLLKKTTAVSDCGPQSQYTRLMTNPEKVFMNRNAINGESRTFPLHDCSEQLAPQAEAIKRAKCVSELPSRSFGRYLDKYFS